MSEPNRNMPLKTLPQQPNHVTTVREPTNTVYCNESLLLLKGLVKTLKGAPKKVCVGLMGIAKCSLNSRTTTIA